MITYNYIAAFFLIVLGFYTIVTKYNLIKTVIGLSIADYGVNLLIISIGYNPGGHRPDLHGRRADAGELLCRSDPPGADADEHRHRCLRHGHEPLACGQAA